MVSLIFGIILILLIIVNGFFVTAEFSLLRMPKTRIGLLNANNGQRARKLKKIFSNFNQYISSLQIGIVITSLAVGIMGYALFLDLFLGLFNLLNMSGSVNLLKFVSGLFAFIFLIFIASLFGEVIPKSISMQNIEETALNLAIPTYYFSQLIKPFNKSIGKASQVILKLLQFKIIKEVHQEVYTEDELKLIIAKSSEEGEIDKTEHEMINRILDFTDTPVKEIITPRYKIVAFPIDAKGEDLIDKAKETGYSRFPLYDDKLDQVRGFVHIKDIILSDITEPDFSLKKIMRRVVTVHEGMVLDLLLRKMKTKRTQIAIVVDEYGSVEGLVTIEDVIEEIMGEIDDEFDDTPSTYIEKISDIEFTVNAEIALYQFNLVFAMNLEGEDAVTLAGFLLEKLENLPKVGMKIQHNGCEFVVENMVGNRIDKITLKLSNDFDFEKINLSNFSNGHNGNELVDNEQLERENVN